MQNICFNFAMVIYHYNAARNRVIAHLVTNAAKTLCGRRLVSDRWTANPPRETALVCKKCLVRMKRFRALELK